MCKSNHTCDCKTRNPAVDVDCPGKVCTKCDTFQARSNFGKSKKSADGLQWACKGCEKVRRKAYYKATPEHNPARKMHTTLRRELVRTFTQPLVEKGCVDCGQYIPNAMDFDHIVGEKLINISGLATMRISEADMLDLLQQELNKCVVRCANCHRKITMARHKTSNRLKFMDNPEKVTEKHRYLYEFLQNSSCIDCQEADFRVLELDHVKGSKFSPVSKMLRKASWSVLDIEMEITKCEVRCVNCHRQKTYNRLTGIEASIQEEKYTISENDLTCICGNKKSYGTASCTSCYRKPKIDWPHVGVILEKLENQSYVSLGRELGVSDNAIRKYLVRQGVKLDSIKKVKK